MTSNVPPAHPRRAQGKLARLTPEQKAKRAAKRAKKKTWAVRVWARRHIKSEPLPKPRQYVEED